jgi:hypothetical protein
MKRDAAAFIHARILSCRGYGANVAGASAAAVRSGRPEACIGRLATFTTYSSEYRFVEGVVLLSHSVRLSPLPRSIRWQLEAPPRDHECDPDGHDAEWRLAVEDQTNPRE